MEFKGTKRKWVFRKSGNWCEIQIEEPIKSICAININVDQHIANAKLIASAPEMFEMLKKFLSEFEYDNATEYQCELFYKAKQILTKITE